MLNLFLLLTLERLSAESIQKDTAIEEATAISYMQNMLALAKRSLCSNGSILSIPNIKRQNKSVMKILILLSLLDPAADLEIDHQQEEKKSHQDSTRTDTTIDLVIVTEITDIKMKVTATRKMTEGMLDLEDQLKIDIKEITTKINIADMKNSPSVIIEEIVVIVEVIAVVTVAVIVVVTAAVIVAMIVVIEVLIEVVTVVVMITVVEEMEE